MKYLSILLLAVVGCATVPAKITNPYPTLGMPIAQARIDNAAGDKPAVANDLTAIETAAKKISADYVDDQQMRAEDDAFILKHNNDWLGAKTHRIAKWLIFLGFPIVGLIAALLTYTGGIPAAGHILLGILSGGIHFIHLALIWVISKVRAIRATKSNAATLKAGENVSTTTP
jgi:hypothetical protein